MQLNAIERLLDLSACYLGLRECGIEGVVGAAREALDATPEQGGAADSSPRCSH